jgi:hypothetical protein
MLRMISVFVMGLLPDFFAIAISSKADGKGKNDVRSEPHRKDNSAGNAVRVAD